MSEHDRTFHSLIDHVIDHGEHVEGRNGYTLSSFGLQAKYDLRRGFPLLTTKHVPWKLSFAEMFWFIGGNSDLAGLIQLDHEGNEVDARKLWSPWARQLDDRQDGGPLYGVQWRNWNGRLEHHVDLTDYGCTCELKSEYGPIDQLNDAIEMLRDPVRRVSRRIIVSAWQPAELADMALPPCHVMYQFSARPDGRLDMMLTQRSCDLPIGGPFNVAQYALLLSLVAHLTDMTPGILTHSIGDAHIYENQLEAVAKWRKQAEPYGKLPMWARQICTIGHDAPTLVIAGKHNDIDSFKLADVHVRDYKHLGRIDIPVSV